MIVLPGSGINEDDLLRTPDDEEMDDENVEQLRHEYEYSEETARNVLLRNTAIDFDSIDPEVLREFAIRKMRARPRNTTIVGHRRKLFYN
ncbi:unnamed protein product [Heligmosomoides polygyrus]|uniref:Sigma70_r1_2 domain-containing protein n=1 Tax=Heligmosomoides polygyrus TaxID=6339 RepID=A0A183F878_HELPZ|nr:unnamed protein product [Heligmosomoides polygyrus]